MTGRLRPLAAALLSCLVLGLGQLFAGHPRRALVLLFAPFALMGWGIVCFRFAGGSPGRLALALLAVLIPALLPAADAWRLARRGQRLPLGRAARWACYAGFIVAGFTVNTLASRYVREHWLEALYIPSRAMVPTLYPGDSFMVDRHAYAAEAPALGDVVLYRVPGPDGQPDRRIGRVTAIEPDRYFLQGDNTDEALDSRRLGTIARADILGRVLYISYSVDPTSREVRFERIGEVVK